jgi:hypothetical protein
MERLSGLIKHTLRHKQGVAELEILAAASAQRAESVREGIRLLHARGDIRILHQGNRTMHIAPAKGEVKNDVDAVRARLEALLQETAAYRTYFGRTDAARLIA